MVFKRRDPRPWSARMREAVLPRTGWRRAFEYLAHRVRRIPDTPHRIALGFACGAFVSFTPLFGVHVFAAIALAWALRANVFAALVGTAIGNPLTFPLIASVSLTLGRMMLGGGGTGRDYGRVAEAFEQAGEALWRGALSLFGAGTAEWDKLGAFGADVVWPYFVGGLLPGIVVATGSYYAVRALVAGYQAARRVRLSGARARYAAQTRSEADGPA